MEKAPSGNRGPNPGLPLSNRLIGLVGAEDPGFKSHLRQDFFRLSPTSDLKIGTPVVTLPGAWRHRVSHETGRPSVSILWLGEVESWICNFYLSVAACTLVWADRSLRYTSMLLGQQATNKHTNPPSLGCILSAAGLFSNQANSTEVSQSHTYRKSFWQPCSVAQLTGMDSSSPSLR